MARRGNDGLLRTKGRREYAGMGAGGGAIW